jgi:hypothetical protein
MLPLKALPLRVQTSRGRRKIAVVAAARHILRIAYYVMRDGTTYDPTRIRSVSSRAPVVITTNVGTATTQAPPA